MGLGRGSGTQEGWAVGRMIPGQGCRRGLYWTLKPRRHGFSAPGSIVYQLTLHLCLTPWSFSPGFGGSARQSLSAHPLGLALKGQGGGSPHPRFYGSGGPCLSPPALPTPTHKMQRREGGLQTGRGCALRQSKNDTGVTADIGGQTEKQQQRRTRGTDLTDG